MTRQSKFVAQLRIALGEPSIYRVSRPSLSKSPIDGFVVGLSDRWVLIARTLDGGHSDGLIALRVRDVSKVTKDTSFETRFALTQSWRSTEEIESIDLTNVETVIGTMGNLSRIIAIEEEKVAPGSIAIGRYEGKHRKEFGLLFLGTDATWDVESTAYRSKGVTTVSIDGFYLVALASVAGDPPENVR
jgi:hypothetical protein